MTLEEKILTKPAPMINGDMTINQVIEICNELVEQLQVYRAIGTIEEFKDLKEKNTPKIPLLIPTDDTCLYHEFRCPNCGDYMSGINKMRHCNCGQTLDWYYTNRNAVL